MLVKTYIWLAAALCTGFFALAWSGWKAPKVFDMGSASSSRGHGGRGAWIYFGGK